MHMQHQSLDCASSTIPGRVLVVGAGSIGSRHIRNLLSLGAVVSVYRYRQDKANEVKRLGANIALFTSLEEALASDVQAVVIANRPDQHIPVALAAAKRGLHLFIEKPLSSNMAALDQLHQIVLQKELIVEVGCMMRFHPNLLWIREAIDAGKIGKVYSARAVVGQYLPDWRPTQDYRKTYSAHAGQGGGAVLDLIHELDYLVWWFGPVEEVSAFLGRVSDLEISCEDIAHILLRFKTGVMSQVSMDYLRPGYYRIAEVVGSRGTLFWDHRTGTVLLRNAAAEEVCHRTPLDFDRNMMFLDHMCHFLKAISGGVTPAVSIAQSIEVQQVALAAHRSSNTRSVVRPDDIS